MQIFGNGGFHRGGGGNFLAFRGGKLRFGKLAMHDTDLTILDADPSDPFLLFLDYYNEQLVAGYSKNTPNYGLRSRCPTTTTRRRDGCGR